MSTFRRQYIKFDEVWFVIFEKYRFLFKVLPNVLDMRFENKRPDKDQMEDQWELDKK